MLTEEWKMLVLAVHLPAESLSELKKMLFYLFFLLDDATLLTSDSVLFMADL